MFDKVKSMLGVGDEAEDDYYDTDDMFINPSRGGTRIWVIAGEDALRWVQKTCDRDAAMRALINVVEGRELAVLENKLKEHKKMSKELKKLQKQLDQQAAQG